MRPYNDMVHPRGWRASWNTATASSATCASHVRHGAVDARSGLAQRISSAGGILVNEEAKPTSRHPDRHLRLRRPDAVWKHRTWGEHRIRSIPGGPRFYGEKGTLKASVFGYDFHAAGRRPAVQRMSLRVRKVPRGQDRKGP